MAHIIFLEIFPILVSILFVGSYSKQIITTYKTKDVTGIDKWFWIQIVGSLSLRTATGVYIFTQTGGYGQLLMEFLNLSLAGVMLAMVLKYRKRKTK